MQESGVTQPFITPAEIADILRRQASDEAIRIKQQGQGRPIISGKIGDYTAVATGSTIHWSRNWKTFSDFLSDYIKKTLGTDWINNELAKPLADRHPILQWYDSFCRYHAKVQDKKGEVFSGPMIGVACCYFGLAYSLYLLDHNVELQARLVARLKDVKQFQGAYYELIVANCLIRSGFKLELEDESDQLAKHCEFSAHSITTGIRYWVEAKMRSVAGVMGKTILDSTKSNDPTSQLTKHLREALKKPAPDKRIIFIDLNATVQNGAEVPIWLDQAVRRLESRERDLSPNQEAYVFVTNMAFHWSLNSPTSGSEALAHGLGIPDFGKPGKIRLSDWYKQKQKHIDAHCVLDALRTYPQIPDTLTGQPASDVYAASSSDRIKVGETYFFEDVGDDGLVGKLGSVAVLENEKKAYLSFNSNDGQGVILTRELSDIELADYRKYGDAYFGETKNRHHKCKDIFELYEFLIGSYKKTPKERLLELAKDHPEIESLRGLDQPELVLQVCEGWAASISSIKT